MGRDSEDVVAGIDSSSNTHAQDVIGNKSDTVAGDSLVSLVKQGAASDTLTQERLDNGRTIWY